MKNIMNLTKTAALIAGLCAMAIIPEPCSAELREKGDTTPIATEKQGIVDTLYLIDPGKNMDTANPFPGPNRGATENTAQIGPTRDNGHRFRDPVEKHLYDLAELEPISSIGSERRN